MDVGKAKHILEQYDKEGLRFVNLYVKVGGELHMVTDLVLERYADVDSGLPELSVTVKYSQGHDDADTPWQGIQIPVDNE